MQRGMERESRCREEKSHARLRGGAGSGADPREPCVSLIVPFGLVDVLRLQRRPLGKAAGKRQRPLGARSSDTSPHHTWSVPEEWLLGEKGCPAPCMARKV